MSAAIEHVDHVDSPVRYASRSGDRLRADVGRALCCIFDQGVVSAASFATSMLIGRGAGREGLGLYFLALTLVLLIRGIQEQIIAAPYTVYAPRRSGRELRQYTGSALVHQLLLGAAVMLCWLAVSLGSLAWEDSAWNRLAAVLALATPLMLLKEHFRQLALARLQLKGMLVLDLVASLAQIGLLALLFVQQMLSPQSSYVVLGAAAALSCLAWWLISRPPLAFRRDRIGTDWRHNWSFGRWALTGFLIGSTGSQIIPWLLASLHDSGAAATGLLAANLSLVGLTNIVSLGMSNLLSPRAARTYATHGPAELRRLLLRFAIAYLLVLGCFCLVVAATGDSLIVLVYGQQFAGSGAILLLLALNVLVNSLGVTAGNGLWAIERPQANFAADGCMMMSTIIAALALIGGFGAIGAAAAMLIGTSVGTLVRMATLQRAMRGGA